MQICKARRFQQVALSRRHICFISKCLPSIHDRYTSIRCKSPTNRGFCAPPPVYQQSFLAKLQIQTQQFEAHVVNSIQAGKYAELLGLLPLMIISTISPPLFVTNVTLCASIYALNRASPDGLQNFSNTCQSYLGPEGEFMVLISPFVGIFLTTPSLPTFLPIALFAFLRGRANAMP